AAKRRASLEVRFFKAYNGNFRTNSSLVLDPFHRPVSIERLLALFPDDDPPKPLYGDPYIGDYFGLTSVGNSFYGTFCASGQPEPSHFPSGVYYQRNVKINGVVKYNFSLDASGTLADESDHFVDYSIDPFFFYDVPGVPRLRMILPELIPPPQDPH